MKKIEKSIDLGGRTLTFTTGELAGQAAGAVLARMGDTVVLATVAAAPLKAELDYFPLSVEYQEKLYAGGRIKGSRWVKRDGKPTDEEILTARLIDRSIRPLFPKTYKKEVQIIVSVLSVDLENNPSILSALAASAAVHISGLAWKGPVSILRVGIIDGKYSVNPFQKDMEGSPLDLVVSGTKDAVLMIEAGAKEVTEAQIVEGVEFAQKEAQAVIALIEDFAKEVGRKQEVYKEEKPSADLEKRVKKLVEDKIPDLVKNMATHEGVSTEFGELIDAVKAQFEGESEKKFVLEIIDHLKKDYIREQILKRGIRPDGRKLTEIRPLAASVGLLPRTHGSGLFTRGQTQVLSITTLGSENMGQLLETAEGEYEKRYMHHYSMPPFTTGEVGRVGNPGRREIGHGALAEKALVPVIPESADFPYAIRVVSEVMSSNGSTSMASVCGSTLSLMDAGVPIKAPVSGIAMGLIIEDTKNFAILSDIMGIEDFNGDMDFKVAGTEKGITALQLDVKTLNLTSEILAKALEQGKEGRAHMLSVMLSALSAPRTTVSAHAPKIKQVTIDKSKIGELIGPGGKTIKGIIADTGATVDVDDDGRVSISAVDEASVNKAVDIVTSMTKIVMPGELYTGKVVRIEAYGAFVQILPGRDGLVHVSDMSVDFVKDPNDIVTEGQMVEVKVKDIDQQGRIALTMLLDPEQENKKREFKRSEPRRDNFDDRRGGFRRPNFRNNRDGRGQGRDRRDDMHRPDRGGSGPHFPTTRLLDEVKDFSK